MIDCNDIRVGMRVRITHLEPTTGMFIADRFLAARKSGVIGEVLGYVPGHGGDVWWVKHDGSEDVGAYCFTETEEVYPAKDVALVTENSK